jgi:hypothetical protein
MQLSQYMNREKINQLFSFATPYLQIANNALAVPVQIVLSKLSLKTECIPEPITIPLNFTIIAILMMVHLITYTNNMFYYVIGMIYPILYNLHLFTESDSNPTEHIRKLLMINKYWILLTGLMLIESILGGLLCLFPFYSYLKIGFLYGLIRNDFYWSDNLYHRLCEMVVQMNTKYQISSYFQRLRFD